MILFSILKPIEDVMRAILDFFHGAPLNLPWAWSIVATTILVRIVLVPLTVRQIHSMQSLQKHAPEMKELQRKYKGDRAKLNEELMKFYKENSINPAASCLPLLAQFPVFIALYLTLRHAKGISGSWLHVVPQITDKATAHWSGYLLLAIYASSQVASTYFMGSTMEKSQKYIMMVLPLVFITFVARFPTGLVLYWVTTNLWTVGQGLVTRRLVPKTPAPVSGAAAAKRSSRPGDGNGNDAKKNGPAPKPTSPAKVTAPQAKRVKRKKGGAPR